MDQAVAEADPNAPLLRITGIAVMGALEISSRPTGGTMKADNAAQIGQIGQR
jgi:hypothetical protein